jgi:hypothetical protein
VGDQVSNGHARLAQPPDHAPGGTLGRQAVRLAPGPPPVRFPMALGFFQVASEEDLGRSDGLVRELIVITTVGVESFIRATDQVEELE